MKLLNKWMIALALPLLATACYDEVDPAIPHVDSPVLVSTTPENGATSVGRGDITISVTYDKNVFFATSNIDQLQFTGGTLESADVLGSSNTLTVNVNVPTRDTQCTLTIPEGVVTGPNDMPAPEVTVQFSTVSLAESLADAAAIPEAVSLYNYLLENFETATLSATMADVAWNTDNADKVFQWTGEYPAINCFDYMHLNSSPTDWIDYNDITPVKEWSDKGGIVAAMWHWNVPTSDPNAESEAVTLYDTETTMPSGWGGSVQIPATDLAGARVGSQIIVNITDVTSGAQGSFKDGSTWLGLVDENGTSYEYFDISGESFSITLDATTLEAIQTNGLIISGQNYTLVSVTMTGAAEVEYNFYAENNAFDATNALTEGTWENNVYEADMAEIISYLTLLQDENIPVLWRPFHEAAGGWFWWGKDATSFKALWIDMFTRFQEAGLHNLIWVWTSETGDDDWYPGDQYVDIIGRDLYGNTADDCATQYSTLANSYGNKMVALSECGYGDSTGSTVGLISEQWNAGARWSWFMPWYDNDDATTFHSDAEWWQDAMNQSYVISLDELPTFN